MKYIKFLHVFQLDEKLEIYDLIMVTVYKSLLTIKFVIFDT